jgi:hypothetical protein
VGVDRPDDDDTRPLATDTPAFHGGDVPGIPDAPEVVAERDRLATYKDQRASADAAYRAHAIDQGCETVRETEETIVTPAMRRIESEDPDRHLVGLEFRLKGKDRLTEKVTKTMDERGHTAHQAFEMVKDAIRYTFCYPDNHYTEGVLTDCERLKNAGFELVDRPNSWHEEQYKGINSRWRVPENSQVFEVQFHTQASFEAKQETHSAYEKLRVGVPTKAEQRELEEFQRRVTARIPIPPGALEIPNYP